MENKPVAAPQPTPFDSAHAGPPPPYNKAWTKTIPAQNQNWLIFCAVWFLAELPVLVLFSLDGSPALFYLGFCALALQAVFMIIERTMAKRLHTLPPTKADNAIHILGLIRNIMVFQFVFALPLILLLQRVELILGGILVMATVAETILIRRRNFEKDEPRH